jgi:hypothetical protein
MIKRRRQIYLPTQIPDFPLIFEEKTFFKYRFQRRNRRKLNASSLSYTGFARKLEALAYCDVGCVDRLSALHMMCKVIKTAITYSNFHLPVLKNSTQKLGGTVRQGLSALSQNDAKFGGRTNSSELFFLSK